MNLARVIGTTTATVKHTTLNGWRMLIVQPLLVNGGSDGSPLIAVDNLGSRVGENVIITSDGKAVREAMGSDTTPVRWMVMAQPD
jgi:ethanolamine utilization protein EutN